MTLYHKWDFKNDFAYVLQFFSLISDGAGGVIWIVKSKPLLNFSLKKAKYYSLERKGLVILETRETKYLSTIPLTNRLSTSVRYLAKKIFRNAN